MRIFFLVLMLGFFQSANAADFKEMKPFEFVDTVSNGNDVRLVFIFTSWCSVCKTSFKDLVDLSSRFKGKKLSIIAVSLDENEDALKKYLATQKLENFNVHLMKYKYISELQQAFGRVGIGYSGSIPHITLITQSGEIVADGNYKLTSFDQGLHILLSREQG